MPGRGRPARDDEPAVTFELEETPRQARGNQAGVAAGAATVAGAGLVSSAAASVPGESLDVFDQLDTPDIGDGGVPVTSFADLVDDADAEFPPIDFAAPASDPPDVVEATFGAVADVGGGFTMSDAPDDAFGAAEHELAAVPDTLVDDDGLLDDDLDGDDVPADDIDLP